MDWTAFLDAHGIAYDDSVKNELHFQCPFCGEADQGTHMGLSTVGNGWNCWRNNQHRGKSPVRLIVALIGCTYDEARRLSGDRGVPLAGSDSDLSSQVQAMLLGNPPQEQSATATLALLPELKPLQDRSLGRYFIDYLVKRGYSRPSIPQLVKRFGLCYSTTGSFAYRIVFPIYNEFGLANWTGRAISNTASIRYKTLTVDTEKSHASGLPAALKPIHHLVWDYPNLKASHDRFLFITEGPFDGLKLAALGLPATCIFGTGNLTEEQSYLIEELAENYEQLVLLLDREAAFTALAKLNRLAHLNVIAAQLPEGYKDPGELDKAGVDRLMGTF